MRSAACARRSAASSPSTDVSLSVDAAADRRGHRPQRRRQVDAVQPDHRPHPRPTTGTRRARRPRHHRRRAARHLPHGHGPLVPAHQHLPQADRVRERAGRLHRASPARAPISGRARRGCTATRRRALLESLGLADQAETIGGTLVPRQPEAARARHRAGQRSRRSCCSTSRPPACPPAETRETIRLLERIAAERGLTLLFTEHDMEVVFSIAQKIARAAPGPADRRRHPGGGARQRRGAPRLSRESGIERPARGPRHPHRLRPVARAVRHLARGRRAASASACSAATASASRRRCARSWA